MTLSFPPTRAAALTRLHAFAPDAGRAYARDRNFDRPDAAGVSALSPYIRHRMLTEPEVLASVRENHSDADAEKFIQEVFWRTYWKGWLELRPSVWDDYVVERDQAWNDLQTQSGLRTAWEDACLGRTGIECFDHWAQDLAATGYLHNHSRMWFASIWIFTLRLPWSLGADFFLRHLLDGDAASNTLSWRWVAGLQTIGKTYLARPDNITKYTEGRFRPKELATHAVPVDGTPPRARGPAPTSNTLDPAKRTGLLITEDDMSTDWLAQRLPNLIATETVQTTEYRSPLAPAPNVIQFVEQALSEIAAPLATTEQVREWATANGIEQIATPYIPVGPTRDALGGLPLVQIIRPYDNAAWPHATHGFFRFKDKIPKLLSQL